MSESTPQLPERSFAPERTCVACGAKKPQRELLRVALVARSTLSQSTPDQSTPVVDASGKAEGRGAYLCFDVACAEKALKRRSFERSLKLKNPAPPEFKSALNDMIVGTTSKNSAER